MRFIVLHSHQSSAVSISSRFWLPAMISAPRSLILRVHIVHCSVLISSKCSNAFSLISFSLCPLAQNFALCINVDRIAVDLLVPLSLLIAHRLLRPIALHLASRSSCTCILNLSLSFCELTLVIKFCLTRYW